MSIKIMSQVWENGPNDRGELLVLLALADFANDAGECWPAMSSIAAKARMTERGAQKVIARLTDAGRISVARGGGRHGCNVYKIEAQNPERGSGYQAQNPEPHSPNTSANTPNTVHPERGSPRTGVQKPRTGVQKTPNGGSPEPSGTVKNRHSSSSSAREQPQQRRVEIPDEDPFRSEPPAPPPDQLTGDDLLTEVMAAAGLTSGRIPTYWMPPTSTIHILKWRNDLGLTDTEILDTVRSSRANHDEAPSGPKAFDRAMSGLAGAKSHKLQPSSPSGRKPADGGKAARLDFYNRVANQKG